MGCGLKCFFFYQLVCYVCLSVCACVRACVWCEYVRKRVCMCICMYLCTCVCRHVRRSADKSLAQPGRKQAIVIKLGIYSTYSPRSTIHYLAHCSNFYKPLKKNQKFSRPTRSQRQQWPPRQTKNGELSIVLSVQGTVGSPTGPDSENRVGDQDIGNPGRPVSSGLQVPRKPEHCRARTRPPWRPSRDVFPSKRISP